MKYDDASWHYGGEFPEKSPQMFGATHIALFMKWCFYKGWVGEIHIEEEPEDTRRVVDGKLSATEFFIKYCDEKLTDEDFSKEGNIFAQQYYGDTGLYLEDYAENFGELMYLAPEKDHDYKLFSSMLDARFNSGILTTEQASKIKPWWKLW